MAAAIGGRSSARTLATILAAAVALFALMFAGVLAAVFGSSGCGRAAIEADASARAALERIAL